MEEILDLYEEPYDPLRPMICFDERPYQMLGEVRDPLSMAPGKVRRFDSEYKREGMAYVHMAFEPLRGWREVEVSERRRGLEFAQLMHHLAEEIYPDAEKIRLIEFCYTPVHGSWLNMAEIEISVLVRQCLERRLPDKETLRRETKAWQGERNRKGASVNWRFRTEDARIKLRSLYPSVKE
jgi:hypothetical protein